MVWIDIGSLVVAILALLLASISYSTSKNTAKQANTISSDYNNLVKGQIELQKGQAEMQVRELIANAQNAYSSKILDCKDKEQDEVTEAIINAAYESVLNAYDEACAKYNDEKIDKVRFKKMYMHEIRQLVESNKDKYTPPTSRYNATLKVYNEWNNLEA